MSGSATDFMEFVGFFGIILQTWYMGLAFLTSPRGSAFLQRADLPCLVLFQQPKPALPSFHSLCLSLWKKYQQEKMNLSEWQSKFVNPGGPEGPLHPDTT